MKQNKQEKLINFDIRDDIVEEINSLLDKHHLELDEKQYIIKEILGRINTDYQRIKTASLTESLPLGGLLNRFIKTQNKQEE